MLRVLYWCAIDLVFEILKIYKMPFTFTKNIFLAPNKLILYFLDLIKKGLD